MSELVVSIITVCFNAEEFIEQTIESVAGQSYGNIEFIVVDGDSTDDTVNIICRNEKYITKWVSEPDEGIADAFNKGFALSSGDYVLYLNSDDKLHDSDSIQELVSYAVANALPEVVYGDCNVLNRETNEIRYRASIDYRPEEFLKGKTIPHPSLLLHRSYFEKYGVFDKAFSIAMDYELFLRGVLKERVFHAPCLVTDVRDGGVSTKYRSLTVEEIIKALVKNHHLKPGFEVYKLRFIYFLRGLARRFVELIKV